jgi:hypothetical protein
VQDVANEPTAASASSVENVTNEPTIPANYRRKRDKRTHHGIDSLSQERHERTHRAGELPAHNVTNEPTAASTTSVENVANEPTAMATGSIELRRDWPENRVETFRSRIGCSERFGGLCRKRRSCLDCALLFWSRFRMNVQRTSTHPERGRR